MMKTKHNLPSLNAEIIGELDEQDGLALFRGIPFASVKKRWTHSRTNHSLESPFDATEFGPRCVQGQGEVLVSGGITDPIPGDDEFSCLNLNVTVPQRSLPGRNIKSGLLPVMFWIHGGAFNFGANSVARYRPLKLSSLGIGNGTPVVLVQINYRLGPFGFAASNDLASELSDSGAKQQNGDSPPAYLGNYGLIDQRNALEWVRDHISDFGGDPSNVTAFGISAGSASVHYHILTGDPLFDRAIMMSGAAPTLGPLPFERFQSTWESLCNKCGVQDESASGRLERLRALSTDEILQNYSSAPMGGFADGQLLPTSWSFANEQPKTRCKSIILGDTRVEAIILDAMSHNIPQQRFHELIQSSFSPTDANAFSQNFGFAWASSYEEYRDAMRHFLSVAMFQYSNLRIAESYSGDAYLYHFEEPSPYPGPTFGVPYHGQCALYMYNNESDIYPASGKHIAEEMARLWTAFAYGKAPWESYQKSKRFMRLGPDGESAMMDIRTDKIRDYKYVEWLRDHFEPVKAFTQKLVKKT